MLNSLEPDPKTFAIDPSIKWLPKIPDKNEIILDKAVDHPKYYSGKVECIDAMAAATEHLNGLEALCTGIAIKYLWRWKKKNGVQDLKKCVWYINRMIEEIEKNNGREEES